MQAGSLHSRFGFPIQALRPVYNTTLNSALRYVVFASTLVKTQHDARMDSDPILAFLCVVFLRLVVKKSPPLR